MIDGGESRSVPASDLQKHIFQQPIKGETAMEFLSKLLQGISFLPAVISGIEGLFGGRPGAQQKDAALSYVHAALSMSDAVTNRELATDENDNQGVSELIDGNE